MEKMILVTRSAMPSLDEYIDEIRDMWDTHWLTNRGPKYSQFQTALLEKLKCPYISLMANGHLALEYVLEAFDFPAGSEVITTPFTFASTTNAIVRNGLVPVFCDVRESDFCIDPQKIEDLISKKTVAILPVHVYGNMCDIEAIDAIAKRYDLKVIYDAAHAFGVEYKGVSSANFGDAVMFSFHATKVFQTIEGGAICCKDEAISKKLYCMTDFGIYGSESCIYIGGNGKMNEFEAAMGLCNLRHIDEEIEKRKKVADQYRKRLQSISGIRLNEPQPDVKSNFAYFPVIFDGYKKTRDNLFIELFGQGILSRKYFYPLTSDYESYREVPTADSSKTPIAKHLSECVLCLPMYGDLAESDIDRICDIILG